MKYSLRFTKKSTTNEVVDVEIVFKRGASTVFGLRYTLEDVYQNGPVFDQIQYLVPCQIMLPNTGLFVKNKI